MSHRVQLLSEIDLGDLRLNTDVKRASMMVAYGLWVEFETRWIFPTSVGPCMVGESSHHGSGQSLRRQESG